MRLIKGQTQEGGNQRPKGVYSAPLKSRPQQGTQPSDSFCMARSNNNNDNNNNKIDLLQFFGGGSSSILFLDLFSALIF